MSIRIMLCDPPFKEVKTLLRHCRNINTGGTIAQTVQKKFPPLLRLTEMF